jgi:hypothetical protein
VNVSKYKHVAGALFGGCLLAGSVCSAEDAPMYFFYNVAMEQNIKNMAEQLQLADSHGVKPIAFHMSPLWPQETQSQLTNRTEQFFKAIESVNTNALFIPRCFLTPPRLYREKYPDEFPQMPGCDLSPENHVSLGSDFMFDESEQALRAMVRHLESSRFGDRTPVYYLAAQETGEWIPYQYRNGGADRSKSNTDKFREWLTQKYQTDDSLQSAWENTNATLESASVPDDNSGRFPMRSSGEGETVRMFYRIPEEQNWVDYSRYVSDITVQRICDLAAAVKEETGRKKKNLVFYGYAFELAGSMSGHLNMGKILRNPDIDMIGAPMSYINYSDRLSGGSGGCMTALDSMPLHGKKWLTEVDTATYAQKEDAHVPDWYWDSTDANFDVPTPGAAGDVLTRAFAFACAHRATLWWMDLFGAGWFSDSNLWNSLDQDMGKHFFEMAAKEQAYTPDVAVIVDEKSRLYENCTWSGFFEIYPMLRNNAMLAGASTGFYYLDDFLEGRVPPTKVCVFSNLWKIGKADMNRIHEILKQNKSTAIWQYAPGWMSDGCAGIEQATGIQTEPGSGGCVSFGEGLLNAASWGPAYHIDPRIDIKKRGVDVLARYADGEISAACKTEGGITHYLLCSPGISTEVLRRIYKEAGVHLWCSPEGAVNTDGKTFVHLHASRDAEYSISVSPAETKKVPLKKGESVFIKL